MQQDRDFALQLYVDLIKELNVNDQSHNLTIRFIDKLEDYVEEQRYMGSYDPNFDWRSNYA